MQNFIKLSAAVRFMSYRVNGEKKLATMLKTILQSLHAGSKNVTLPAASACCGRKQIKLRRQSERTLLIESSLRQ